MAITRSSRLTSLIKALETLPHSELPEDSFLKANFYPFSNERNLNEPIKALKTIEIRKVEKNTLRVAVLIGESSFISILPELSRHCDVVVFADINPYLIQHLRQLYTLISHNNTINSFIKAYDKWVKQTAYLFQKPKQVKPDLAMRKETLGDNHFLASKARFEKCKNAVSTMKFAFCHSNLFHENDRNAFFNCIQSSNAQVTFFNATNLYEWDAKKSLAQVASRQEWQPLGEVNKILTKMQPCPIIMGSLRENARESCPLSAKLFHFIEEYLIANQIAARNFLNESFGLLTLPPFKVMEDSICPAFTEVPLLTSATFTPYLHVKSLPSFRETLKLPDNSFCSNSSPETISPIVPPIHAPRNV